MRKLAAVLLLVPALCFGERIETDIIGTPELRNQLDLYVGRVTAEDEYIALVPNIVTMRVVFEKWDAVRLGKPAPKSNKDLPTPAQAAAWKASITPVDEKKDLREGEKLLDEVVRLRKELEAVKADIGKKDSPR